MMQGHLKLVNVVSLIVWSLEFRVQGHMYSKDPLAWTADVRTEALASFAVQWGCSSVR